MASKLAPALINETVVNVLRDEFPHLLPENEVSLSDVVRVIGAMNRAGYTPPEELVPSRFATPRSGLLHLVESGMTIALCMHFLGTLRDERDGTITMYDEKGSPLDEQVDLIANPAERSIKPRQRTPAAAESKDDPNWGSW